MLNKGNTEQILIFNIIQIKIMWLINLLHKK